MAITATIARKAGYMKKTTLLTMLSKVPYYSKVLSTQPSHLLAYYPFTDLSGTVLTDLAQNRVGNILPNPSHEAPAYGGGGYQWTGSSGNGGSVADDSTLHHTGAHSVKVTTGTNNFDCILRSPNITVVPGTVYPFKFWQYADGSHSPRYRIYDVTHSADIVGTTATNITAASWQQFSTTFTAPAGCLSVWVQVYSGAFNTSATSFDDFEVDAPAAVGPMNGALAGSGTTLGVAGIGDGKTSWLFNGSGYVTLPSALINAMTSGGNGLINAGSYILWAAFSESDAWYRNGDANHLQQLTVYGNATNELYAVKAYADVFYHSPYFDFNGTVDEARTGNHSTWGTKWFMVGAAWDISAGVIDCYWMGSENDDPTYWQRTFGAWTYAPTQILLGAYIGPARQHKGSQAHVAFWDTRLNTAEMARLGHL